MSFNHASEKFHLHVAGAKYFSIDLRQLLDSRGLHRDDFNPGLSGSPLEHWAKTYSEEEKEYWRGDFDALSSGAGDSGLEGYVEAEVVSEIFNVDNYDHNQKGAVKPFPYVLRVYDLSQNIELKESELHFEFKNTSNSQLLQAMRRANFQELSWRDELIFTAQGDREMLKTLMREAKVYIESQGGANGRIVRETFPAWGFQAFGTGDYRTMLHTIERLEKRT